MEGGGVIAHAACQGGQRGHPLLRIQLIGHSMGRLEDRRKAGEVLKLHAGRPAAGHWGVHPATDCIFFHGVQEGRGVLRYLQPLENGQVGKGLVHHHNDVRGPRRRVPRFRGIRLHQLQHLTAAVILRLVQGTVPQGHREVQQKAVGLSHPLLGVDPQGGQGLRLEKDEAVPHLYQDQQTGQPPGKLVPLPLRDAHPNQKEVGHQQHRPLAYGRVQGKIKGVRHVGRRLPGGQVRRKQDPPPKAEHIVVHDPHKKAEPCRRGRRPPPPAQDQAAQQEQQVVPDQVHQHLPGVEIRKHVVPVQDLHHPEGHPRTQQKNQAGQPLLRSLPDVGRQPEHPISTQQFSHSSASRTPAPGRFFTLNSLMLFKNFSSTFCKFSRIGPVRPHTVRRLIVMRIYFTVCSQGCFTDTPSPPGR